jgi:hypothetical protein
MIILRGLPKVRGMNYARARQIIEALKLPELLRGIKSFWRKFSYLIIYPVAAPRRAVIAFRKACRVVFTKQKKLIYDTLDLPRIV